MVHKFSGNNKHKLDNEKRREALPPYKTLDTLGLKEGDIVADIGCGIGYFSLPASEIVGNSGKVYAMDISIEMLEELEQKIEEGDSIIRVIATDENGFKLEDNAVTYAFICNVLHEAKDMRIFLTEAKRILEDNGKLVIVEWKKEESDYGPPIGRRLSELVVKNILKDVGFNNINHQEIGEYFYAITGYK